MALLSEPVEVGVCSMLRRGEVGEVLLDLRGGSFQKTLRGAVGAIG